MTVVYVDVLFLLNGTIDYLLLLASARLAGEPLRRVRFGLGAALGGGYAVSLFLPGMGFLAQPACRLAAAVLMLVVAYGKSGRLLRQSIIFFALSCALGGGILAAGMLGRQELSLEKGVAYSGMDVKALLLSAAVCYVLVGAVLQRVGRHTSASGELLPARLRVEGRQAAVTVLVDTGNTLTDPATGRAVMVAEGARLAALFPEGCRPTAGDLSDPISGLERLGGGAWRRRLRLLPYRAVGIDRGLLLALRVDGIRLGEEELGPMLVALSPTPLSDGGGYHALIGPWDGKDGRK